MRYHSDKLVVGILAHVGASRGVPHKSPLNVPQFAIQAAIKDGRN